MSYKSPTATRPKTKTSSGQWSLCVCVCVWTNKICTCVNSVRWLKYIMHIFMMTEKKCQSQREKERPTIHCPSATFSTENETEIGFWMMVEWRNPTRNTKIETKTTMTKKSSSHRDRTKEAQTHIQIYLNLCIYIWIKLKENAIIERKKNCMWAEKLVHNFIHIIFETVQLWCAFGSAIAVAAEPMQRDVCRALWSPFILFPLSLPPSLLNVVVFCHR